MTLKEFFNKYPKFALGFSGGTDSAYLLYAANKYGADIKPYYIKTAFQPQFEYNNAVQFCEKLGISLTVIEYNILSNFDIADNPSNRCYYCKKSMFSLLKQHAKDDGYSLIIDGTNASDNADERPGIKALDELSVRSPLKECGLTKDEIRRLSKEACLFTWNKPAYACLATRIPYGTKITHNTLTKIEKSENFLAKIGFSDFRVRVSGNTAKLQVTAEQFDLVIKKQNKIFAELSKYFDNVLLDMKTR